MALQTAGGPTRHHPLSGRGGGSVSQSMDPAKLPESLRPFLALYEKWGAVGSDTARYDLFDRALADPAELAELKAWHARLSKVDPATYEEWLGGPLGESHERAKVYFTDMLMYFELEIHKR